MSITTLEDINRGLWPAFPAVQIQEAYLGSVIGERVAPANWTSHSVTLPMRQYEIKSIVVRVATNK